WVCSDKHRLEIKVYHLPRDMWRKRRIADSDQSIVGEDLDDEPSMKRERCHGLRCQSGREEVHRIGAKMRRQWHRLSTPLHNSSPNFLNLHMLRMNVSAVAGLLPKRPALKSPMQHQEIEGWILQTCPCFSPGFLFV